MAFYDYDPGDPIKWYQSRSDLREPAAAYGGDYHGSHFHDYSHSSGDYHGRHFHGYSHSMQFQNPHLWMRSPNPAPPNPVFYNHSSYSPPPLPNHTIINGHSLPLQFPFSSQISQPMNHQPSPSTYYPHSQLYNPHVCLPTQQFHAQPSILPTKAPTTPPIYQLSQVPPHDVFKPSETNLIDQVTYTQFSYASLQLEDTKVATSANKSSPRGEHDAESGQDLSLVDDISEVQHGGQHYEPEIVLASPLNKEPCLQIPDPKANGAIDDESVCDLTPSLAFVTSKGHTITVSEKTSSSMKESTPGVCENAAEDLEAINLGKSYKVISMAGDKPLDDIFTMDCTKPVDDIPHRYDLFDYIATGDVNKEEFLHIFIALVYASCKLCPLEVRRNFLWNMFKPKLTAMIVSYSTLVNVKLGKPNLSTGDKIEELKQNVDIMFEKMWEHRKLQLTTETAFDDIGNNYLDRKLLLGRVLSVLSFLRFSLDLDNEVKFGIAGKFGWFLDMLEDEEIYSSILDLLQVPVLYGCGKIVEVAWQSMFSPLLNALQIFMLMVSSSPALRELESFLLENFFVIELGCFIAHHAESGMMSGIAGNLCLLVNLVASSDSILVVDPDMGKVARSFIIILIFGAQSMVDQVYMAIVRNEGNQLSLVICLELLMKGFQFPLNLLSAAEIAAKMRIVATQRIMTDYFVFMENFDEKSISSFDCHVFGDPIFTLSTFLLEQSFNFYKGNSKLSNEITQGQASMRLVNANLVLGLFTSLNGPLRVDLASLMHGLLVWNYMKTLTHYCSQIIVGIQVVSRLYFLQMAGFWFNDDKSWNVSQRLMEFKSIIIDKDETVHYHLHDYYVSMKDFPQIGFDGDRGIQKDFTGQEPIGSLNLQLCHGNLATVCLAVCLHQGEYFLRVIKYKPGTIRMNLEIIYGRVIKFSTLNQMIVPKAREENAEFLLHNAHFLALGFSTDLHNHLNILIHIMAALYSIRMAIVGMLHTIVANEPSVFCFFTNGESNSTDILRKSPLKGYSLCTIATQVSTTVCLRTRASFLSWTLSSGCCKYRLTLAGVYVDAFSTILIKNAEYSLVVWHNIMVRSFFNEDCPTQWGITMFIYFGFISLHGCFCYNSMRIAFDSIIALKMLNIICSETFLKTGHGFTRHEDMPYVKGAGLLGLIYLLG